MTRVLMLNPIWQPHKVISWEAAVRLVYCGKAETIETYDEEISSPSVTWKMPAVIRLKKPLSSMKRGIKFSRINVFTRDEFRCSYCGQRKQMRDLNYDHVIPRDQGGRTDWNNIVTSCYPCNDRKANRTPEQAGMTLRVKPRKPKTLPMSYLSIDRKTIPTVWEGYVQNLRSEEGNTGLVLLTGTDKD